MAKKGLLMVHTGNGKGKTTAALGLVFRAMGHNLPVSVVQFIKGAGNYGELRSAERFKDLAEFHIVGEGFTWESQDLNKDRQAAINGWNLAKSIIAAHRHHIVVLDEFTYALNYDMVNKEDVMETLRNKPEGLNIVVTGRDAPQWLVEMADLVTEMQEVKHPFRAGIKASKGIEW